MQKLVAKLYGKMPVVAAFALLVGAGTASAQFVTSITRPVFSTGPTTVYEVNTTTGASTQVFDPLAANPAIPATAPGFTGLAYDATFRRMFAITTNGAQSDLYSLDIDNGWVAVRLSQLKRPNSTTGIVMDGLAFDQKRRILYGTRTLGGTGQDEGLYSIDPATGATTLVLLYEPTTTSLYTIGGIDWCPVTDKIYLSDDDDTTGRNIYSIDAGTPTVLNLVTAYDTGVTDIDGLAAGGGKLYLLSDSQDSASTAAVEGNNGLHRVYNLLTSTWEAPITSPYPVRTTTNAAFGLIDPTGGGAWIALGCNLADIAGPNQSIGPDQTLSADDIIVFLSWYFAGDFRSDVAGPNQATSPDGSFTADDIIVYLARYFAGCV